MTTAPWKIGQPALADSSSICIDTWLLEYAARHRTYWWPVYSRVTAEYGREPSHLSPPRAAEVYLDHLRSAMLCEQGERSCDRYRSSVCQFRHIDPLNMARRHKSQHMFRPLFACEQSMIFIHELVALNYLVKIARTK